MKKIILPKTIIWTLLSGLGFLLLMSFIRIVFVYKFPAPTSTDHHLQSAYILGFRYDLRYVTIMMMVTLLLSFIKPLHPFKQKIGKKIDPRGIPQHISYGLEFIPFADTIFVMLTK
jgi:hypothetical protein